MIKADVTHTHKKYSLGIVGANFDDRKIKLYNAFT
jgi:hypothetical protein